MGYDKVITGMELTIKNQIIELRPQEVILPSCPLTQDSPLVLTYKLNPTEVDDMFFDLDVSWSYPLEFYNACLEYKNPWDVKIDQIKSRLGTEKQYEGLGFTHDISNLNSGVRCSAYKTLPTMEEKLKGQMLLAEKIRAVDESDVARLV